MELRQLRYFLAVSEELHFGRAAARVHISQPPLSQQIRQLEEDLQVRLFHRTSRKVELTEAGRVLVGEARLILQQVEHIIKLAAETNRSTSTRLIVGCSPPNWSVVVKILRVIVKRYPKIHIVVKSLVTPQQVEALHSGRIDVGFVSLPVDREGLAVETLLKERLVVAMPTNHRYSGYRRVAMHSLAADTFIIFPLHMTPGRYGRIAELCRGAGFSLNGFHEVDNIYTMLGLISAGCGVSLMRASVAEMKHKGVVFRELQHSPVVEIAIAYKSGNRLKFLRHFIDVARKVAQQRCFRNRLLAGQS